MILSFSQELNGKPTYFIEKIFKSFDVFKLNIPLAVNYFNEYCRRQNLDMYQIQVLGQKLEPKLHTIREDKKKRWGAGSDIHFVINSRTKNYFQFAPVIKCKSVQTIEIKSDNQQIGNGYSVNFKSVIIDGVLLDGMEINKLAINDGFDSVEDFFAYFNKDFKGVIVHWSDLKY